jgi:putative ABC transport system permease protein
MASRPSPHAARAFGRLLRLYPSAFRDEYGHEMVGVFRDRFQDAHTARERAVVWFEALAGLFAHAPLEHARALGEDLTHASRRLARSPTFTLSTILTLGLALGASITAFAMYHAVTRGALPYPDADRLVMVWTTTRGDESAPVRSAWGRIEAWGQARGLDALAAFDPGSATIAVGSDVEQLSIGRTSPDFFDVLGVRAARGRLFTHADIDARHRVVVISHAFWHSRLSGRADAIGARVSIDGTASEVIGILPRDQTLPGFEFAVWEPASLAPGWDASRASTVSGSWFAVGLLADGVSIDAVRAELGALAVALAGDGPASAPLGVAVTTLRSYVVPASTRRLTAILVAATLGLLLAAAANVGGMSLAKAAGRLPDTAVRLALGATGRRLVRDQFAESALLAAVACAFGLGLATFGVRLASAWIPLQGIGPAPLLTPTVLATALAAVVVTTLVAGLTSACLVTRRQTAAAAMRGGRGVAGGAVAGRSRKVFVAGQCAVALVLLVAAGLLVRSWIRLTDVDPGFDSARVRTIGLAVPSSIADADRAAFYESVLTSVRSVPGVERAGVGSEFFVNGATRQIVRVEGRTDAEFVPVRRDEVSAGYFETLGTTLRRGRLFNRTDAVGAPPVAVVTEAFAARVWPGEDPLGRRFAFGPTTGGAPLTVVGVVADMRRQALDTAPVPQVFEAVSQQPPRRSVLLVKASVDAPLTLAADIREALRRVHPSTVVYAATTIDAALSEQTLSRRLQTMLVAGFALAAMVLSMIGVYSLLQYAVVSQRREIAVRLAVGARAVDIYRLVIREGLLPGLAGVVVGIGCAFAVEGVVATLVFEISSSDPLTFAGASLLILTTATMASAIPAVRASHLSPAVALKGE